MLLPKKNLGKNFEGKIPVKRWSPLVAIHSALIYNTKTSHICTCVYINQCVFYNSLISIYKSMCFTIA